MKLVFPVLISGVLACACATAPDEGASQSDVADSEKVECRRVEELGSNLGRRVCMTESEWAAAEEAEREANEDFLRRNSTAGRNETPPGGALGN